MIRALALVALVVGCSAVDKAPTQPETEDVPRLEYAAFPLDTTLVYYQKFNTAIPDKEGQRLQADEVFYWIFSAWDETRQRGLYRFAVRNMANDRLGLEHGVDRFWVEGIFWVIPDCFDCDFLLKVERTTSEVWMPVDQHWDTVPPELSTIRVVRGDQLTEIGERTYFSADLRRKSFVLDGLF